MMSCTTLDERCKNGFGADNAPIAGAEKRSGEAESEGAWMKVGGADDVAPREGVVRRVRLSSFGEPAAERLGRLGVPPMAKKHVRDWRGSGLGGE